MKITSMRDAKKAAQQISGDLNQIGHELHEQGQKEEAEKVAEYRDKFSDLAANLQDDFDLHT